MQAPGDTHTLGSFRKPAKSTHMDTSTSLGPLENTAETSRVPPCKKQRTMAEPNTTVGQFSLLPATQMTTVTTTTTTTINLEPFILKPPADLADRDPKQFPLAFTPTPASMRRIDLEFGGLQASFQEPDNATHFLQSVREYRSPYK